MNHTIIDQIPMMERTKAFVEKYGCKVLWIAEHTGIPSRRLSSWMHGNELLYENQFERLTAFLNEYEQCMSGFSYTKDGD